MKTPVTEEQINQALNLIRYYIGKGWSVQVSLSKACGVNSKPLNKAVRKSEGYLELLNKYMATLPNTHYYSRDEEGKIRPLKKNARKHVC